MNILDLGNRAAELADAYFKDDDPGKRRYRNVRDGFLAELVREQYRAELLAESDEPAYMHYGEGPSIVIGYTEAQLAAAVLRERELVVADEEINQWKAAVVDKLAAAQIFQKIHESQPDKALNDLINWNTDIALDPLVSSDAQGLVDRGKRERDAELLAGNAAPVAFRYKTSGDLQWQYIEDVVQATHASSIECLLTPDQFAAAVLRERDRCALACYGIARKYQLQHDPVSENIADECACAIWNRGTA